MACSLHDTQFMNLRFIVNKNGKNTWGINLYKGLRPLRIAVKFTGDNGFPEILLHAALMFRIWIVITNFLLTDLGFENNIIIFLEPMTYVLLLFFFNINLSTFLFPEFVLFLPFYLPFLPFYSSCLSSLFFINGLRNFGLLAY